MRPSTPSARSCSTPSSIRPPRAAVAAAAVVVVASAVALAGCRGMTSDQPPIHLNQNMDDQQRKDPQEASTLFPDGRAMRPLVPGTVPAPIGAWSSDPVALTGRSGDAYADALPADIVLDAAFLERGRQRYDVYCTPCHGATGEGNGTVVARGLQLPPTFHDDRLRAHPMGQLYEVITQGIRTMPPYAHQVAPRDRWAIAAYVRVLQRSRVATIDQVPPAVAAEKGWQ